MRAWRVREATGVVLFAPLPPSTQTSAAVKRSRRRRHIVHLSPAMKIQLLLLLVALAGSVCTFTLASPIPDSESDSEAYSAAPLPATTLEALSVVTGPPEAEPTVLPEQYVPLGTTRGPPAEDTHATAVMTMKESETERYVVSSAAAPRYLTTVRPVEETSAPAEVTQKAATEVTAAVETGTKGVLEEGADGASEGLSSGQVFGIVIGCLVAVVVVIAVVSAVVRRMGKYSP